MFTRKYKHKRYEVISEDGFGIVLKVPKYEKTNVWMGTKEEAKAKGLKPKGSKNFYKTIDGSVVEEGYLAKPTSERKVEMSIRGKCIMTKGNLEELNKEISLLLNEQEG
jgi:hypothetical protein